jgi:hypothetical protein
MLSEENALLPQSEESLDLAEAYRELIARYNLVTAHESDTYSLAQPSPFRFIPTSASNKTAPLTIGE